MVFVYSRCIASGDCLSITRGYHWKLAIGSRTLSTAISICPACGFAESVERFPRLSAVVSYYLCKRCGLIWAVRKDDPTVIQHFTPLRKRPK